MTFVPPALHQAIFCVDVESFGARGRTDPDRVEVRAALYRALCAAFTRPEVTWGGCYHEDRGDGVLVLVPGNVTKEVLVGPVLDAFAAALNAHNQQVDSGKRIRARVAVHAGEIRRDDHGVVGAALNHTYRLLDADAAKDWLRNSSATLVLIASDWFFEEVIRHTPQGRSGAYRQVSVAVKETRTDAWLYLPDGPRLSGRTRSAIGSSAKAVPTLPVPRQVPSAVRRFVGRSEELATLARFLDEPDDHGNVPIVAITGTAGMGKTALAVHWAHQVRDRFPDGDLYVDLRGYGPGTPVAAAQALDVLLHGLGVPAEKIPIGVEAKTGAYRSHLTGRRVLVVLDNAADAEQVRPLLPSSPGCTAVVTSRSRLEGLVAGDGACPLNLDHLPKEDAFALLRYIIGAARVDNEPAAARDIARHCALLPLALRIAAELAAARHHVALVQVAADLASEEHRLDLLDTDDPATAVRAVFSWSYRALPADLARVFRLLGLHPGSDISVEAAATLLDTTPAAARRVLDRLTRLHLLEETAHGRYYFHDLLRCYAAEAAGDEETTSDRAAAERRIIGWYLHALHDAGMFLSQGNAFLRPLLLRPISHSTYRPPALTTPSQALEWWFRESINGRAATRQAAVSGHHDLAWRLPVTACNFFYFFKHYEDWITALEIGLGAARSTDDHFGEAAVLICLGWAYHDHRRFEKTIDCSQQALRVFRETDYPWGQAAALHNLGAAHRGLRRFEEAIDCLKEAKNLFREVGDRPHESFVLIQLGYSTAGLRRFAEAVDHFQNALAILEGPSHRLNGWVHHGLSHVYSRLGQYPQAMEHAECALALFEENADCWGKGEALYGLGRAQHLSGQHHAAHQSLARARTIFEDLDAPRANQIRSYLRTLDMNH